jgi:hypothetical protein
MTISSIFILLVIFILTAVIISRPFLDEGNSRVIVSPGRYDSLLAERERLLSSIEDLDLEYELEKISSREHTRNRDLLLKQAAEVLMQLDKLDVPSWKKGQKSAVKVAEVELEEMIEARRQELKGEKSNLCPQCGKLVKPGDLFCSHCGEGL